MRVIIVYEQIRHKRFWKSLEECTLTCKDGIKLEVLTKLSIRIAKHRGSTESMIAAKVEVVRIYEDFPFGAQYIIFQF
jgi:hypothetical protein